MPEITNTITLNDSEVDSVIWELAVGVNDGLHARLELMLKAGEALAGTGADVKAACKRMDAVSANLSVPPSSLQVEVGKAIAVIEHFGSKANADQEIDAYNFGSNDKPSFSGKKYDVPKRPCYNIRTLAVKLGVVKQASKGPSALELRLNAAVDAGIITKSQAVNIAALEV